jgi:hypothetical protein
MPRPKQIDRYPQSYFDLFERAYAHPMSIPTSSPSAAANLRSELYTFRRVLREGVGRNTVKPRVALIADDLQFRVEGKDLIVERRPLARGRLVERILERQQLEDDDDSTSTVSAAGG